MSEYAKKKVRLLKQFGIHLTYQQKKHLEELQSEIAIDNWSRSLILRALGDEK